MIKVLVTNGEFKNTLAFVRGLKKGFDKNCEITVTSSSRRPSLSSVSRYCKKTVVIPFNDNDSAYSALLNILKKSKYDILIPVGLDFCELVAKHSEEFKEYVKVMAPQFDSFIVASEKDKTMKFARENQVPIPQTYSINCIEDINKVSSFIQENKSSSEGQSCFVMKSSTGSGEFVYYCNSAKEAEERYLCLNVTERNDVICQEYVSGFGCGYFGLYDNGRPLAEYMHKRLKEYPISGGPSVEAESFYDEKLLKYGRILCKSLNWTGPIMCEFKYSPQYDDYKLIEINPKLWGSLDLTIAAGVNIPQIMVDYMQNGDNAKSLNPLFVNKRYVWVIPGEILCYIDTFPKTKFRSLFSHGDNVETNIVLSDPLPTIYLLALTFMKIIMKLSGRGVR